MRPSDRVRQLGATAALVLAAAVAAGALVPAAAARPWPEVAGKRAGPPMTSIVPYVAPWATEFTRYSTQTIRMTHSPTGLSSTITVPEGQWYRVLQLWDVFTTSAVAGTRTVVFDITRPDIGSAPMEMNMAISQGPSTRVWYTGGPGLGAFTNTADPLFGQATFSFPDVLWPQHTFLQLFVQGAQANDAFTGVSDAIVEVYTEAPPGAIPAADLTATPLLG